MRLLEGAKISQQLLQQAINDPNFTFGIEAEFYLKGANEVIHQHMTQGLETMDFGGGEHFVKKLGDMDWHNVTHFFKPLSVKQHEERSDTEVIQDRFENFYERYAQRKFRSGAPDSMWEEMKKYLTVPMLMVALHIFPEGRMMGIPENQSTAIRDMAYDGTIDEIQPYTKLNDIPIALGEVGYEFEDYSLDNPNTKAAFYNLVAKDLSVKLQTEVLYVVDDMKVFHVGKYESWVVTHDSSLSDEGMDAVGVEVVSSVMPAAEGLAMLDRLLSIMNGTILGLEVVTTEKTGLHINLGVKYSEIDPVKILVLSGDEHIVNKFDRAANANAASIQRSLKDRMATVARGETPTGMTAKDLVATAQDVLGSIETDGRDMARVIAILNDLKPEGKMHSINFEKLPSGYVEYRAIGNAGYHKRKKEIRDAVLHMIGITDIATDPSAYRQEFLKKLYMMVRQSLQGQQDVPIAASVGMIGHGPRGGYGAPIEDEPDTPYDGENFMTQFGFDAGSDTQ
jgi:hypothetical protein